MATQIPSIWNTLYTMFPFPGGKIHFHSTSYYGLKWLEILEISFTCSDQNKGEHCSCFQHIFRFWNSTSIVNSFLIISCKCSLVNKSSKFSLPGSVSSFYKVVLHVGFFWIVTFTLISGLTETSTKFTYLCHQRLTQQWLWCR